MIWKIFKAIFVYVLLPLGIIFLFQFVLLPWLQPGPKLVYQTCHGALMPNGCVTNIQVRNLGAEKWDVKIMLKCNNIVKDFSFLPSLQEFGSNSKAEYLNLTTKKEIQIHLQKISSNNVLVGSILTDVSKPKISFEAHDAQGNSISLKEIMSSDFGNLLK